MSVNKVNSDGSLSRVAGGTLYADAPIGTISPFGGSVIPNGYLLCNGAEVLKTAYAELYAVIGDAFGTASDNTKFVVPDLRGEFLRGAGTNSHAGQGNGGEVGEHQDATIHINGYIDTNGSLSIYPPSDSSSISVGNVDSYGVKQSVSSSYLKDTAYGRYSLPTPAKTTYRSRPTNTSVNYIIKAKQVAVPFDVAEYIRNQNVLSDIETVTLPMTAPYDGELIAVGSNGGYVTFRINGNEYTVGSSAGMTNTSGLSIKKGDNLQLSALIGTAGFTARYYKLRDYTGR